MKHFQLGLLKHGSFRVDFNVSRLVFEVGRKFVFEVSEMFSEKAWGIFKYPFLQLGSSINEYHFGYVNLISPVKFFCKKPLIYIQSFEIKTADETTMTFTKFVTKCKYFLSLALMLKFYQVTKEFINNFLK